MQVVCTETEERGPASSKIVSINHSSPTATDMIPSYFHTNLSVPTWVPSSFSSHPQFKHSKLCICLLAERQSDLSKLLHPNMPHQATSVGLETGCTSATCSTNISCHQRLRLFTARQLQNNQLWIWLLGVPCWCVHKQKSLYLPHKMLHYVEVLIHLCPGH